MGTRASYFIGNPADVDDREWLGCTAWNSYPSAFNWGDVTSEVDFRAAVDALRGRKDFADPRKGFPFPWSDDLFLTDYTYAWFDNQLQVAHFHGVFEPFSEYDRDIEYPDEPCHRNVPAPSAYNPEQPDSIMLITF